MQNKKEKKFISIVLYLHNVRDEVLTFFQEILPYFEERFEQFEIIGVNDDCTDGTVEVLKEYLENRKISSMVNLVHMSFFHGMEGSMNAGRDLAIGDFVYEFDTIAMDYSKEMIEKAFEKVMDGYDIVGVRPQNNGSLSSRTFYFLYNKTSRGKGKIGTESFRILSRRAINRVKSMGQYIPYRKAVYANCGLKTDFISYIPIKKVKKNGNRSERTSLALDSFIYFTDVLERFSMLLCVLFLCLSIGMGIYIIKDYFSGTSIVEGWLSTMGFLSLGFFGVFALLTIMLKYLSVMLNLIFRHQRYFIMEIEKVVK
ncbi:MAG: glycosyltransferase [Lachnospiraceae bacterium]|nr:glycosyltransferase [Lachnospiraceae bacterium]